MQSRFQDLFADIGGYLGLLLGYSLLSIYDKVKTTWTSNRPHGKSRKQDSKRARLEINKIWEPDRGPNINKFFISYLFLYSKVMFKVQNILKNVDGWMPPYGV